MAGMTRSSAFSLLAAALLCALPVAAQRPGVLIEASYYRSDLTGSFQLTGSAIPPPGVNPSIDLISDLAVAGRTTYPVGVRWLTAKFRVEGEYTDTTYSGESIPSRDLVFQGTSFPAGTTLSSSIRLRDIAGHFRWDLWSRPTLAIGIGADVDYVRYQVSLAGTPGGAFAEDSRQFAAPSASAGFNLHDPAYHAFLDVRYSYLSYQGDRTMKTRIESGYGVTESFGIKLGWRKLDVKWTKTRDGAPDDRIDFTWSGYYGGLYLVF
jgi:hypothetical protein